MKLILTPLASEDIVEIFKHTLDSYGIVQSEKYFLQIQEAFEIIKAFPSVGHNRRDIPAAYLAYPAGVHIIIYRHDIKKSEVIIVRLLHSRMDFSNYT